MINNQRKDLRPVSVQMTGGDRKTGYFHCFGQLGSNEDGIETVAIIELENGEVLDVSAPYIKFEDV